MAFTDDFNRASLGSDWETVEGTEWTTQLSQYLYPQGDYEHAGVRVVGTFNADQTSEVFVEPAGELGDPSTGGPAVRMGVDGDCYYVRVGLTSLTIYKHVNGVDTYLSDAAAGPFTGGQLYRISLVATGTALAAYSGDTLITSTTNGDISAGNPGVHVLNGETPYIQKFDNYTSTEATSAGGGGVTRLVGAGQAYTNLQTAINEANLGDTLVLTEDEVFTGNFTLPVKAGSALLTITTAGTLPLAGVRAVAADAAEMAIVRTTNSSPVFATVAGAHHYLLKGLEITTTVDTTADLVLFGDKSGAQATLADVPDECHIYQCYIHGHVGGDGTKRGVALDCSNGTIMHSTIVDFMDDGADAQAVMASNGPGPYRIENCRLEASGECVMFGGSDPTIEDMRPSDIVVRRNYMTRPIAWKDGLLWSVKNVFELKNAHNVLIENNIFENNWVDSQPGYAIVFTPRNQDNTSPWCNVTDVTFKNNWVRKTSSVFNILGTDSPNVSGTLEGLLIENNLFTEVQSTVYGGGAGRLALIQGGIDISFNHNTCIIEENTEQSLIFADGIPTENFSYTNNIAPWKEYGIMGSGASPGNSAIAMYHPGSTWLKNVFWGPSQGAMPANNFQAANIAAIGFTNEAGGDYSLTALSTYHLAGTDGLDLGCNLTTLTVALAGVEAGDAEIPPVGGDDKPYAATQAAIISFFT